VPVTKNQHYVPQFYLKLFSRDGNMIYTYDKVVSSSDRQVYCAADFGIIPDLIARFPELADPNRTRVTFR
jgi:hypothetical protein